VVAHQGNRGIHIVRAQHRVTGDRTVGGTGLNAICRDGHRRTERSAWVGQGITSLADPGAEVRHRLLAAFFGWRAANGVRATFAGAAPHVDKPPATMHSGR
jgi:hypothetical protein